MSIVSPDKDRTTKLPDFSELVLSSNSLLTPKEVERFKKALQIYPVQEMYDLTDDPQAYEAIRAEQSKKADRGLLVPRSSQSYQFDIEKCQKEGKRIIVFASPRPKSLQDGIEKMEQHKRFMKEVEALRIQEEQK